MNTRIHNIHYIHPEDIPGSEFGSVDGFLEFLFCVYANGWLWVIGDDMLLWDFLGFFFLDSRLFSKENSFWSPSACPC